MGRRCRTVSTTTAAVAVHARHNRATAHARVRLGRTASTDEVGASGGGAAGPEVSSADFTALENWFSISLLDANPGLGYESKN